MEGGVTSRFLPFNRHCFEYILCGRFDEVMLRVKYFRVGEINKNKNHST